MIPPSKTKEALERLQRQDALSINKYTYISGYLYVINNPDKQDFACVGEKSGEIVSHTRDEMLKLANEFVNEMAETDAREHYKLGNWDEGLHD